MIALVALGVAALATPSAFSITPRLIWNTSASAPLGFYWVAGSGPLNRHDFVLARLPESVRLLANERGYLPLGVPLIKPIAGLPRDHICTIGRSILVDGKVIAQRLKRDALHRRLPAWKDCRLLRSDEVLLLHPTIPDSFDGRYFGPMDIDDVIGRLVPIWTWSGDQTNGE
jgi:conjugative transfer signal peptidase TraF